MSAPGARRRLVTYGCGSPIRQPIIQAMAAGSKSDAYLPQANPVYQGGDAIVWGLIRGAQNLMQQTRDAGCDYYQIDNAYFGRNQYYRVTRNALQLTRIASCDHARYRATFQSLGLSLQPWKTTRNGPIVICLSSAFLFAFYDTDIKSWSEGIVEKIRAATGRPVRFRAKDAQGPIDPEIADAWCVVTHVSAAALDALRLGIPVVTTGECAASPLATPLAEIDNPRLPDGREDLFATLAHGQFTPEEMASGQAWSAVSGPGSPE